MTENAESLNPYFHFMQPVLDVLKELGGSGGPSEVTDRVAELLGLTEEQLDEQLPSGQSRFPNRVSSRWHERLSGCIVLAMSPTPAVICPLCSNVA